MLGIGQELKNAREERGLSIDDVERETKIKSSFIIAIENEDFDKIPGRVYVKGFVKNYAKLFGLDYHLYLQKLNEFYSDEVKEDILVNSKPELIREIEEKPLSTKIIKAVFITIIFLALAWGVNQAYIYLTTDSPGSPQVSQTPEPGAVAEPSEDPQGQDDEDPSEDTEVDEELYIGQVVLDIIMSEGGPGLDACWVQVITDGRLAFEETIYSGREPMQFIGKESVRVTFGNAGAIRLKVNGEDLGSLGGPGEVGTRTFLLKDLEQ